MGNVYMLLAAAPFIGGYGGGGGGGRWTKPQVRYLVDDYVSLLVGVSIFSMW